MPVIQVNNKQYSLKVGTTLVGAGESADVPVPAHETLGVQAVVEVGANRDASIRRASPSAAVRVNGVALGVEPIPLLHGDRVEIAGHELLFAEDERAGATRFLRSHQQQAATAPHYARPAVATAPTGGRLVSLVDGREYPIPAPGIVIGRDAGCDVVVPHADVSRRHAEIVPAEAGYVLTDLSTNGVFVNGERVKYSAPLGRGDVIRVGTEEFRFYADEAGAAPAGRALRGATGRSEPARGTSWRAMWALLAVVVAVGAAAFLALR